MPPTAQAWLAVIPAVLLMFTLANSGGVFELNIGATVPLKLTTPDDTDVMALINAIFCTALPVKVVTPSLFNIPALVKSPFKMCVPLPA